MIKKTTTTIKKSPNNVCEWKSFSGGILIDARAHNEKYICKQVHIAYPDSDYDRADDDDDNGAVGGWQLVVL